MAYFEETDIVRFNGQEVECIKDIVVEEYPLTLFLGGKEIVTLLCSPEDLEYLVIGFLLSEGFIKNVEDIANLRMDSKEGIADVELRRESIFAEKLYGSRTITSGCGRAPVFYNVKDSMDTRVLDKDSLKIEPETVIQLMKEFDSMAVVFKQTGGVHSCALGMEGIIEIYHEDIGRHNAVDKVLGHGTKNGVDFENSIVVTSGRISSEMLIKVAKRGIPVIVSRSAPTALSVKLAKKLNITLIGFVRGKRFNVYSGFHRIK
ncbi:MAG: formate dehydrogenase accessory sulfurtransferase FdhD [Bacillota bacterium]|nr:formate dehydrogenase accessory sulfurtransferase FdhD [Bacillota bacterium]